MIALALLGLALARPSAAPIQLAQDEAATVEQWQLDQVRIAPDTSDKVLKQIEPTHSLDEVIAVLNKLHIPFERTPAVLLPDRMPEKLRTSILALPKGEPFVLPEGPFISISVLIARKLPPGAVRWQAPRRSLPSSLTES